MPSPSAADIIALVCGRFAHQLECFADAGGPEPAAADAATGRSGAASSQMARSFERLDKTDTAKKLMQILVMEEMAKLIALRPMLMMDAEGDEDALTTSVLLAGFHGQDFASAMMRGSDQPAGIGLPK